MPPDPLSWLTVGDAADTRRLRRQVAFVFGLAILVSGYVIERDQATRTAEQQTQAVSLVESRLRSIEQTLHQSLSATYALAALVRQGRGEVRDFEAVAREMIRLYPGIGALQLAPGGIVRASVPLAGNERAIGHNLLADPARTREAFLARDTGRLTLAGPFDLVQGGQGAVGRLPVFLPARNGSTAFWGFTSVLIRFPQVLESSGLGRLKEHGYHYVLWRTHPDSGKRQVIASFGPETLKRPVELKLAVPNGEWTLSAEPVAGWGDRLGGYLRLALGALISLLLAAVAALALRQPVALRHEDARRTRELAASEARFRQFFEKNSTVMLFIEPDTGAIQAANDAAVAYYGYPRERLVSMSINDINTLPPERIAEERQRALREERSHFLFQHRLASGELRDVEVHSTPIHSDGRVVLFSIIHDITERKRAEAKLQLAVSVFTHSGEGILITDENGRIVDANAAFTRITGYRRDEVMGKSPRLLKSGRQTPEFYAALWQALRETGHWHGELWNQRKNGETFAERLHISAVHDDSGRTSHYVAIFSDITAHKEQQRRLEHVAHYDALTELPNRVLLTDRLHLAMTQAVRRGRLLALAYIDLDGFKAVNDAYGHETGDQLLIAVAQRMKHALREGDTLARMGGDEFVAVLIDLTGAGDCAPTIRRLLAAAGEPVICNGVALQVSASIGVTFYPQSEGIDAGELLRQGDQAMYLAKQAGKDRFHVFDREQDRAVRALHEEQPDAAGGLRSRPD